MEHIEQALKIAERSGLKKHKTGCVIVNNNIFVANGWSHYAETNLKETHTVHAELHAVWRSSKDAIKGSTAYIACFSAKSGNPTLSKPCPVCMPFLADVGIKEVVFTIQANGEIMTERILL